jgi:hypothetical protein
MATTRTMKNRTERPTRKAAAIITADVDELIHRYVWLLVPVLVLIYYWWFSRGPDGLYQQDEIGHYRGIVQFWQKPLSILGNQPKPGWKILLALPGLLGFRGVVIAHCLIAALTVVCTYFLGRTLKIKNASVMALLLAAQPLFLQLSFRSYGEITAGLFAVLMLLFYYRGNYILAALTSSYIFSIRQEFAIVSIGLGVVLLYRRQWLAFLCLAWTPLALALMHLLADPDPLWLLKDMAHIGAGIPVPHQPFWHYFGTIVFIVGPVVLALFTVGYFSFLDRTRSWKAAIAQHGFLCFVFTSMWAWVVLSAWDAINFGPNPGHSRYVLSITPLMAIYAGKGLNIVLERKQRLYISITLGLCALLALAFLSRETDGFILTDVKSFAQSGAILFLAAVSLLFVHLSRGNGSGYLAIVATAMVLHTGFTVQPLTLQPEDRCMKEVSDWYKSQPADFFDRPTYCNHVNFYYFSDITVNDPLHDRHLDSAALAKAPSGSIIIWESHYGNNPSYGGNISTKYFENNVSFRLLKRFMASDQRFGALAFEKVQ